MNNLTPFLGTAATTTTTTTNAPSSSTDDVTATDDDDAEYVDESKLLVYDEYGLLVKEFGAELFHFKAFDLCIDEENDHLYVSTRKYGIIRFDILEDNFYFEQIRFDGRLDMSELFEANKYFPTCMNLVENEEVFGDSMRTTGKRRLIFNDRDSQRIISVQVRIFLTF